MSDNIIVETSDDVLAEYQSARESHSQESEAETEAETPEDSDTQEETQESADSEETEETAEDGEDAEDEETDDDSEEDDSESEDESEEEQKPKKRPKSGFKKRIDKLNARIAAKEQENYEMRQRLAELEQGRNSDQTDDSERHTTKKVEASGKPVKPSEDDFDSVAEYDRAMDDYVEKVAEWKVEQKFKAIEEKQEQQKARDRISAAQQAHNDRVKEFAEKTPDYLEVIQDGLYDFKPTAALESAVIGSEYGPAIVYELAQDEAKRDAFNSMDYPQLMKEIGKMEYQLSQQSSQSKPVPQRVKSKAPKPIKAGATKGSGVPKSLSDPNLSQKEYERLREEQIRKKSAY